MCCGQTTIRNFPTTVITVLGAKSHRRFVSRECTNIPVREECHRSSLDFSSLVSTFFLHLLKIFSTTHQRDSDYKIEIVFY